MFLFWCLLCTKNWDTDAWFRFVLRTRILRHGLGLCTKNWDIEAWFRFVLRTGILRHGLGLY